MSKQRWVVASGNAHKLEELAAMLSDQDIELISQKQLAIPSPAETASTFIENALIKARFASALAGLPALADDSGIVVPALKGKPGVYSARYAGEGASDEAHGEKLLRSLKTGMSRAAFFHCSLVLVSHESDPSPMVVDGRWQGTVAMQPKGSQGFGYDPIFLPLGSTQTAAEMTALDKNRQSHRGQALTKLLAALANGAQAT